MKHALLLVFGFVRCSGFVIIACSLGTLAIESTEQAQDDNEARTKLEFDAVHRIHVHLDDDKNGDVDVLESKEFLQHELNIQDSKRHSKFHSGDGSITVDELWQAWLKSEVSQWTPQQVSDWLKNVVHLPQYVEVFVEKQINGRHLPRLASSDDDILSNELKISNVIDRKKIALRAMDVVLFGAPRGHNYLKDVVLGLAVLIAMAGFWFSNVQKRKAQKQMEVMMKDIECLQEAEKNLTSLQDRLHQAETSHQVIQQEKHQLETNLKSEIEAAKREAQRLREAREDQSEEIHTRLKLAEQELIQVREALRKAEKEVENCGSSEMSWSLQKWLQITYQKEVKHFVQRRASAMRKMEVAKDACDKINKKRNSLFGSLRLAHDQNIDEVDQKILAARSSLAEVTNALEELQHRWHQIETCCRLDLGVSSSFLSDPKDLPSSPVGQALAMCGKVGSLGSGKSHSRESLAIHRVFTYPTLQRSDDNPPPYKSTSYSNLTRHTSAPTCAGGTLSKNDNTDADVKHEPDSSQIVSNFEHKVNGECEYPIGQKTVPLLSHSEAGDQDMSESNKANKKDRCINGPTGAVKPKKKSPLNSDTKILPHKKKWWSRNKRHSSLETYLDSDSDMSEGHRGSLPDFPHEKTGKPQSDDVKFVHPLRLSSSP